MNFTTRMVALMTAMRRERNGAVADDMRVHGAAYGLNYGVSLSTVRAIARATPRDHDFACYLYLQDIREMRLAAFHIADPERLTPAEFSTWAVGVVNSEVAGEAAFAFLNRAKVLPELFDAWISDPNPLLQYAALMAAAQCPSLSFRWVEAAIEAVRRNASCSPDTPASPAAYAARLTAQGAVALCARYGTQSQACRLAVLRAVGTLGNLPAENLVQEELAWQLVV